MVDRQQLLSPIAHGALGGKQIFGRSFVSDERIGSDISQRINRLCLRTIAADQATAFVRGSLPSMGNDLANMDILEKNHR